MADRTSARIFGMIFDFLAENPNDKKNQEFAQKMWDVTGEYDFDHYQMDCDDALVTLGLAKLDVDPEYPDGGKVMRYYPFEE